MRKVWLGGKAGKGKFAWVDDQDYDLVKDYHWHIKPGRDCEYAKTSTNLLMHRLILGVTDSKTDVDHIDHDGLNNRRSNIRVCTRAQNRMNSFPNVNSSSHYKGVSWSKDRSKWRAQIKFNGKITHIGLFDYEMDAARAYDEVAKKYFGDYARPNFRILSCA